MCPQNDDMYWYRIYVVAWTKPTNDEKILQIKEATLI